MNTTTTLSAQERAIAEGKTALHENVTPRIVRMFEAIRGYGDPRVQISRAALFTEGFKANIHLPMVQRWANALKHLAEHIAITIMPGELIVGRPHDYWGRYALIYPEVDGTLLISGIEAFKKIKGKIGYVATTDEDEKVTKELLHPFWNGNDYLSGFAGQLPEPTRQIIFGPDKNNITTQQAAVHATATIRSSQNIIPDFARILTLGCQGIREDAKTRLDGLANPSERARKAAFLEAVVATCDALAIWARRYAERARELAAKETDPTRKQELQQIAAVCDWVPEHPARSFWEAVQVQWFVQMFARLEQNVGGGPMSGRMDQYLWPYYEKDVVKEKTLSKEAANELLQCVWMNMMQSTEAKLAPTAAASSEGFAHFELVALGGRDRYGRDATNELSYAILESVRPLKSSHPDLCVRIHANTPDKFLHAAVECVKDGKGLPKFLNDEVLIPHYLEHGATMQQALDYSPSSCADNRVIPLETHVTGNGSFSYGGILEMTLRDGKTKLSGDTQLGLHTGDPRNFKTYDDLWKAFTTQLLNVVTHIMVQQRVANLIKPNYFAAPMTSMLLEPSMRECRDIHTHEDPFPGSIDMAMIESIGKATAVDSLAAMKHLIFDTKKVTWDQLIIALDANWEGHEALRQQCLNSPKYGNDIEWVDDIGWEIEKTIIEFSKANPRANGQCFVLKCVPVTAHVPYGKGTWATPNGRVAHEFLSEGISASHGMDVKGPTTALLSMSRARVSCYPSLKGPDLINMKFAPGNVAGEQGTRRLMQVIRAWSQLGLWHIQFNILNRETLLAAQKEPEKYRDLVVRIAGYSAYFVDLSADQQAEIIARTEEAA